MSNSSLIWNSFPNHIKKGNFLLNNNDIGKYHVGTDTLEQFNENLKKMPNDWYYRTNQVLYKQNKKGYRTDEFKNIDWANSIVLFGCSNVFGIGLTEEDTIAYNLSCELNKPVVNMGMPATGMWYSLFNSSILNDHYPTPLGVVQIWSAPDRTLYFYKKSIHDFGCWNIEKNNYMDLWSRDNTHSEMHTIFASMMSKQIWKHKTKYYEMTLFKETYNILKCDFIEEFDKARDLIHPGRETAKFVAKKIAKELQL